MKAVFILLCLAVTAFAVEVNEDFVKSALELKRHVLESGTLQDPRVKRAMLDLHGRCNQVGEPCNMRVGCCDKDKYRCSNWLQGGTCVERGQEYESQVDAIKEYFENLA
ncbi:hypothetical protein LOTGIDRAFT_237898 [Lottia gigantea]|uniref:Uncharacterized protein n=1 Tax=Lottia gigantea TaxID=225164 RepID=V4AF81_LOTGI|nr:hypothetical protein LOTGIDRAFT_237898 [Lottia gigantea]ESP02679.1 hypothetical protein LOTGIDRAFT_237898 [Lottia gigantea]